MKLLFVTAICLVVACGAPKPVPDPNERVTATPLDSTACIHLRDLQCREGLPKRGKCEDAFTQARTMGEPDINQVAPCVISAATKDDVRKCGGPGTLTFSCL